MEARQVIKLNTGHTMPSIALGTWALQGEDAVRAVRYALEAGYRHFDTASMYRNEAEIGEAVRESDVPREEIFITTKLHPSEIPAAEEAARDSLKRLRVDYVDLYLIHWYAPGHLEAWREMEKLHRDGTLRSIGVSNYDVALLKELLENGETSSAAVNQIELSPFLPQWETVEFCKQHGIAVQAYSPLTKAQRLDHPIIREIADKYGKSPAQVLIRWGLEKGFCMLPKSGNSDHIRENIDVFGFELDGEDHQKLAALAQKSSYHLFRRDNQ